LLWLVAILGLVGSALGIVFRLAWWPDLAIAASAVSLLVIAPWWNTVPPGARVGCASTCWWSPSCCWRSPGDMIWSG